MSGCVRCGGLFTVAATGRPRLYCREECKALQGRERRQAAANQVRDILGLPLRRSEQFTHPELVAMRRRLLRLVPAGGMSRYPARRKAS